MKEYVILAINVIIMQLTIVVLKHIPSQFIKEYIILAFSVEQLEKSDLLNGNPGSNLSFPQGREFFHL